MTFVPDQVGRGAWTRAGGLLPRNPGSLSAGGYYRGARPGEVPVGYAWASGWDVTDAAHAVWAGTCYLQSLLGGLPIDGVLDPKGEAAIRLEQKNLRVVVDGLVGIDTMRALLTPLIGAMAAKYGVPLELLGGLIAAESKLDPGAVGVSGWEHGLAGLHLARLQVSWDEAMSPGFAVDYAARALRTSYELWVGETDADPWDIAIAAHRYPAAARAWALCGYPVERPASHPLTGAYVTRVRTAW